MIARSSWNLRAALTLMLGASLVPAVVAQTTSTDSNNQDETVKLEKFEVTGSRVKRLDVETPAPVVQYKVADIESKGYTNIGDFIQSLPFNTGAANSIYQTASFTRGAATANPRGLGAQRFLVLIDGRRPTSYALPNSGNRQVFDFNSLPSAAIDSVEFLKDGASAIYGADALTGVFNIKLKKNYTGMSVQAYYGNTLDHDSALKQFSIVAGAGAGKTRAMVAFDFKTANSNFLRDYGVTTTDYAASLGTNKGLNQNSSLNYPANINMTQAQADAASLALGQPIAAGIWVITGGQPTPNPTLGAFSRVTVLDNVNRYNFANTYQRYPAYDYMSGYAQFEHDVNEGLTAFGSAAIADNRTYYAFTPGVINFPTEGLTLPANSPYNPFGVALNSLLARTSFGPVRKFDTESVSANMVGGLKGSFGEWEWESALNYGFNQVTSVNRNAIRATSYQAALNGTFPGFVGSYLNPFGPSANAALPLALFTSSTGMNKTEGLAWDASVGHSALFTLPGGDVGLAAGVEMRNDKIQTNPDTAAYLGSGGGQPLRGERDVMSAYVELTAPIIKGLEVQLAVRHEDYSDFGETTNPKLGFGWKLPEMPMGKVMVRGSYSESFQAPALALLYASQTIGFSSGLLQDPLRPGDPPQQQRIVTGGNPNLLPEEGETYYAGIVVDDAAGIKDLSFNIDWFKFRINQVIVTPSATFLLSERGRQQFPGAIIRDGAGGPILRIESVPANNPAAYQLYKGIDFGVNYNLRNTRMGDFGFRVDVNRILEVGSDSGLGGGYFNNTGLWVNPKWRGNASVGWRLREFSANAAVDYIGKWFNDGYTAAGWGENPYTLLHVSASYQGFWGTTITVGANNVLDNLPPPNGRDTGGFDANVYGPGALGRFVYVRVRKDF